MGNYEKNRFFRPCGTKSTPLTNGWPGADFGLFPQKAVSRIKRVNGRMEKDKQGLSAEIYPNSLQIQISKRKTPPRRVADFSVV